MSAIKDAKTVEEATRLYKEATLAYIERSRKRLDRLKVLLVESEGNQGLTDKIQAMISDIKEKVCQANKDIGVS